jgi:hypothetical protein
MSAPENMVVRMAFTPYLRGIRAGPGPTITICSAFSLLQGERLLSLWETLAERRHLPSSWQS